MIFLLVLFYFVLIPNINEALSPETYCGRTPFHLSIYDFLRICSVNEFSSNLLALTSACAAITFAFAFASALVFTTSASAFALSIAF